ncbi:Uncharacterized protein C3orf26-like, partial [Cricetulus griseus]
QPMECFLTQPKETKEETRKTKKWKKKKISEILAKSEPKPGTPGDLQQLIKDHYSGSRSVIELEELNLPVCPKWVKLRKTHSEKKSVLMLIMCSSAVRALELIRSLTAFKGDAKVMKLFAKHIKVREQVKFLENRVIHLGVGTPGRIKELVKQDGLNLNPLKFLVFDWNWRDQKLRRMMDIPEDVKDCSPFQVSRNSTPIIPCGAIANSIFNGSAKPLHWTKPVYELDTDDPGNNGFVNEDLIVWMRTAAFPTFKKLYRRLKRVDYFAVGLPAGNYSFNISYSILLSHFLFSE